MPDSNKTIGYRIAAAIAERNITQKELADHLGQKPNVISYWCSGTRTPNTEQLAEIATFLHVSADYLLGLTDVSSCNKDIRTAVDTTGLSEEAVTRLASSFDLRFFIDAVLSYHEINQLASAFKSYVQQIQGHMKPDIVRNYLVIDSAKNLSETDRNAIREAFEDVTCAFMSAKSATAQFECEREFRHLLESLEENGGHEHGEHQ